MTDSPSCCWGRRTAVILFLALAAIVVLLDLWTKSYIFERARVHEGLDNAEQLVERLKLSHVPPVHLDALIPGVIDLKVSVNRGAAFSLGKNLGWPFFVAISLVAAAGIIWAALTYGRGNGLLSAALGLLLGGALGNVWDRLMYGGVVRDFVNLHVGRVHWPGIFNIADLAICCAVPVLAVYAIRKPHEEPQPAKASRSETSKTKKRKRKAQRQ